MSDKLPVGMEYPETDESDRLLSIWTEIGGFLRKNGYKEATVPLLERLDGDSLNSDRFKTVDYNGDILALSNDAVSSLVSSAKRQGVERLFCRGDFYRFTGPHRNEMQFAAIISGVPGIEAECEAITTASDILGRLSVKPGKIVLSNTEILQGVVNFYKENGTFSAPASGENPDASESVDTDCESAIKDLAKIKGGLSAVKQISERISNRESVEGLLKLTEFMQLFAECGTEIETEFDLSYMGGNEFDNGIVYKILAENGDVLIEGARRDAVCGTDILPVVSMLVNVGALDKLAAYSRPVRAVIGAAEGIIPYVKAYNLKKNMLNDGVGAVTLYRATEESTVLYAEREKIDAAIFVTTDGRIDVR